MKLLLALLVMCPQMRTAIQSPVSDHVVAVKVQDAPGTAALIVWPPGLDRIVDQAGAEAVLRLCPAGTHLVQTSRGYALLRHIR